LTDNFYQWLAANPDALERVSAFVERFAEQLEKTKEWLFPEVGEQSVD